MADCDYSQTLKEEARDLKPHFQSGTLRMLAEATPDKGTREARMTGGSRGAC